MQSNSELEIRLLALLESAESDRDAISVRWNRIANVRLIFAAAIVAAGFWWIRTGERPAGVITAVMALLFTLSLVWHRQVGVRRADLMARVTLRRRSIARLKRNWHELPDPDVAVIPPDHPYAHDLDLVGHGSLQQLLDTTQTPAGRSVMRDWLSSGSSALGIGERQHIVQELARDEAWREDLAAAGLRIGQPGGNVEFLLEWLESAGKERIGLRHILAIFFAACSLLAIILYAMSVLPFSWLLPLLLVNGLLTFAAPGSGQLARINTHQRALAQYRAVLPIAERLPGNGPEAARLRGVFSTPTGPASRQLAGLDRALAFVIPAGTIIWFPLQMAVNWDLLVEARLRRKAASIGLHIRGWIAEIGNIESLAAMAELSALNPDWVWPMVSNDAVAVVAESLGHPLIPGDRRVANDVTVGPAGNVLIVTGSNMAGKSTLLRALGLNIVLAMAGGPVCASALSLPARAIWSSVRIQDSLEQGVSLYMAELLRLKQIVDAARTGPIIYLLDEILHGTNTTERRIAARMVIRQLIAAGAIGAVSTHDLELVDGDLGDAAVCVHLVDQVVDGPDGPEMHFDYKLRSGLAPSSNALRLLELVGLGDVPAKVIGRE